MQLSYITNGSKVCSLTYLQISYIATKNVQWSDKFSKCGVKRAGFLTLAFLQVPCLHGNLPERVSVCCFYNWVGHWLTLVWFRRSLPKPPSAGSCLSLSQGEAKGRVYFLFWLPLCFVSWSGRVQARSSLLLEGLLFFVVVIACLTLLMFSAKPHRKPQLILSLFLHLLSLNSHSERRPRVLINTVDSGVPQPGFQQQLDHLPVM